MAHKFDALRCPKHPEFNPMFTSLWSKQKYRECKCCRGLFYGISPVGYLDGERQVTNDDISSATIKISAKTLEQFGNIRLAISDSHHHQRNPLAWAIDRNTLSVYFLDDKLPPKEVFYTCLPLSDPIFSLIN